VRDRFLLLTSLLAAAALIASPGCGLSEEARRDRYLNRGKGFLEKKDYARALVEFKNAVQAMPKDAEPHYQLGVTALAASSGAAGWIARRC
jgi:Tfp pilus assembly protein PilF